MGPLTTHLDKFKEDLSTPGMFPAMNTFQKKDFTTSNPETPSAVPALNNSSDDRDQRGVSMAPDPAARMISPDDVKVSDEIAARKREKWRRKREKKRERERKNREEERARKKKNGGSKKKGAAKQQRDSRRKKDLRKRRQELPKGERKYVPLPLAHLSPLLSISDKKFATAVAKLNKQVAARVRVLRAIIYVVGFRPYGSSIAWLLQKALDICGDLDIGVIRESWHPRDWVSGMTEASDLFRKTMVDSEFKCEFEPFDPRGQGVNKIRRCTVTVDGCDVDVDLTNHLAGSSKLDFTTNGVGVVQTVPPTANDDGECMVCVHLPLDINISDVLKEIAEGTCTGLEFDAFSGKDEYNQKRVLHRLAKMFNKGWVVTNANDCPAKTLELARAQAARPDFDPRSPALRAHLREKAAAEKLKADKAARTKVRVARDEEFLEKKELLKCETEESTLQEIERLLREKKISRFVEQSDIDSLLLCKDLRKSVDELLLRVKPLMLEEVERLDLEAKKAQARIDSRRPALGKKKKRRGRNGVQQARIKANKKDRKKLERATAMSSVLKDLVDNAHVGSEMRTGICTLLDEQRREYSNALWELEMQHEEAKKNGMGPLFIADDDMQYHTDFARKCLMGKAPKKRGSMTGPELCIATWATLVLKRKRDATKSLNNSPSAFLKGLGGKFEESPDDDGKRIHVQVTLALTMNSIMGAENVRDAKECTCGVDLACHNDNGIQACFWCHGEVWCKARGLGPDDYKQRVKDRKAAGVTACGVNRCRACHCADCKKRRPLLAAGTYDGDLTCKRSKIKTLRHYHENVLPVEIVSVLEKIFESHDHKDRKWRMVIVKPGLDALAVVHQKSVWRGTLRNDTKCPTMIHHILSDKKDPLVDKAWNRYVYLMAMNKKQPGAGWWTFLGTDDVIPRRLKEVCTESQLDILAANNLEFDMGNTVEQLMLKDKAADKANRERIHLLELARGGFEKFRLAVQCDDSDAKDLFEACVLDIPRFDQVKKTLAEMKLNQKRAERKLAATKRTLARTSWKMKDRVNRPSKNEEAKLKEQVAALELTVKEQAAACADLRRDIGVFLEKEQQARPDKPLPYLQAQATTFLAYSRALRASTKIAHKLKKGVVSTSLLMGASDFCCDGGVKCNGYGCMNNIHHNHPLFGLLTRRNNTNYRLKKGGVGVLLFDDVVKLLDDEYTRLVIAAGEDTYVPFPFPGWRRFLEEKKVDELWLVNSYKYGIVVKSKKWRESLTLPSLEVLKGCVGLHRCEVQCWGPRPGCSGTHLYDSDFHVSEKDRKDEEEAKKMQDDVRVAHFKSLRDKAEEKFRRVATLSAARAAHGLPDMKVPLEEQKIDGRSVSAVFKNLGIKSRGTVVKAIVAFQRKIRANQARSRFNNKFYARPIDCKRVILAALRVSADFDDNPDHKQCVNELWFDTAVCKEPMTGSLSKLMNIDCPASAVIYNLTNKVKGNFRKTARYRLFHKGPGGKELTPAERSRARNEYCTDELVTKGERRTWWEQHGRDYDPPFVAKDRLTLKPVDSKEDIVRGRVFPQTFINALVSELKKSRFPKKSLVGLEHFLTVTIAAKGNPGEQELNMISEVKKILSLDSKVCKKIRAARTRESRALTLQTKIMTIASEEWKFDCEPTKWFVRSVCESSGLSDYDTRAVVRHASKLHTGPIGEIIVSRLPGLSEFLDGLHLVCDAVDYKEQRRSKRKQPRIARRRKKTARSTNRGSLLPSEMKIDDFKGVALVSELDQAIPLTAKHFVVGDVREFLREPLGQKGARLPKPIDHKSFNNIVCMAFGKAAVSLAEEKMSSDELLCVTRSGIVSHFLDDKFTQDRSVTAYVKSRSWINKEVSAFRNSRLEKDESLEDADDAAAEFKAKLIADNDAAASTADNDDLRVKEIIDTLKTYLRSLVERAHGYRLNFQDKDNDTLEDNEMPMEWGSMTADEHSFLRRVGEEATGFHKCYNAGSEWANVNKVNGMYTRWQNTPKDERKDFVGVCFDRKRFTVSPETMNEYMRTFYRYSCAIVPRVLDFGVDMDKTMVAVGPRWNRRTVTVRVMLQERANEQMQAMKALKKKYRDKCAREAVEKNKKNKNKKKAHARLAKNRTRARRKNKNKGGDDG